MPVDGVNTGGGWAVLTAIPSVNASGGTAWSQWKEAWISVEAQQIGQTEYKHVALYEFPAGRPVTLSTPQFQGGPIEAAWSHLAGVPANVNQVIHWWKNGSYFKGTTVPNLGTFAQLLESELNTWDQVYAYHQYYHGVFYGTQGPQSNTISYSK